MALQTKRIRALCFDIDGTLSDTDDLWVKKFERLLRPLNFAFPNRQVRPFARWTVMALESPGNFVYSLLDRLGLDNKIARIYSAMARRGVTESHRRIFWLVPRAKETLEELARRYPLAVVSARDRASTLAFLDHFQLHPLFKAVATAQTCYYTKPFPDPVLWAAEQMGVAPNECLMIGDTTVDIRAGKAAGAQTVGVLCGFGRQHELERAGADLILPSPAWLPDVLNED